MILILCTGNSCRSQMAEAFLAKELEGICEVASAGSDPAGYVHEGAIRAMAEKGYDLAENRSKHLDEFLDQEVTTVITVCGNADAVCPAFPGRSKRHHFPFDDPAHAQGSAEEIHAEFTRVRDEIFAVFGAYAEGLKDGKQEAQ